MPKLSLIKVIGAGKRKSTGRLLSQSKQIIHLALIEVNKPVKQFATKDNLSIYGHFKNKIKSFTTCYGAEFCLSWT